MKWNQLENTTSDEWSSSFLFLKQSTKDTKLKWLQFRILHHILTTNRWVSKFKDDQNDLYSFCNLKSETICHLFWECHLVKAFWDRLLYMLRTRCKHAEKMSFNKRLIHFGNCNLVFTDPVCDLIILMAKMFIYRCKVQDKALDMSFF